MTGNPIVLVNRTSSPLTFVADGKHHELAPGDNYGYLEGHARFAQSQNPLMGSEDYYSLEFESLVGIKGQTPCDPISDDVLLAAMEEVERFNRQNSGLRSGQKVKPRSAMPRGRMGVTSLADQSVLGVGGN